MTKKIWGVIFVSFLSLFLLGGCGQQKDLKEVLTAGDGKWEMQSEDRGNSHIAFFTDNKINKEGASYDSEGIYTIDKSNNISYSFENYKEYKNTLTNIKISKDAKIISAVMKASSPKETHEYPVQLKKMN